MSSGVLSFLPPRCSCHLFVWMSGKVSTDLNSVVFRILFQYVECLSFMIVREDFHVVTQPCTSRRLRPFSGRIPLDSCSSIALWSRSSKYSSTCLWDPFRVGMLRVFHIAIMLPLLSGAVHRMLCLMKISCLHRGHRFSAITPRFSHICG